MPHPFDILGLAEHVRRCNPEILATECRAHNEDYFYLYKLTISLPGSAIAVEASLDGRKTAIGFEFSSGVQTSNGVVLAAYPRLVLEDTVPPSKLQGKMDEWVRSLVAYYATKAGAIAERLEQGS
jgi:hypothetical protein